MSSTFGYVGYPIEVNPTDLLDEAVSYIQSLAPAWVPNDGNLDTWILQVLTSQDADLRMTASDVPDTIFRYFGSTLLNIMPIDATPARCTSTWIVNDASGYVIPDSTFVTIRSSTGVDVPFQTDGDTTIPPGSTQTQTGQVQLVAVSPGADTSGLGSIGGIIVLLDTLDYVASITQEEVTTGGVDAETSSQYNDRLARHLRRLSTRPILPDDFALLAFDVSPAVARAIAIDLYNPADNTYNNARMVTVSAIDENGNNLDGATKTLIQQAIAANREVNFIVNIMDPNRTQVDVTFTAISVQGADPAVVQADAITGLQNYLSPSVWGRDPRYLDNQATWIQVDKAYYFEIAEVINTTQDLDRIVSLQIGPHGGTMATTDVPLATPATLGIAGTITGTVTSS
jgi:hypothetical protein